MRVGRIFQAPTPAGDPLPLGEASARLVSEIRRASMSDHLTLIEAPCGLGKTEAAITIARERALKLHTTPGATGLRAPLGSKTVFSFPTNALAIEASQRIAADGTKVKRIASLLTVLGPDGRPACVHHDFARALADGGQSIREALCDSKRAPCQHRENCIARESEGVDGPDDARVTVTNHGLLRQADAEAGSSGLLVVDEIPSMVETCVVDAELLEHAAGPAGDRFFDPAWLIQIAPKVESFLAWLRTAGAASSEDDYFPISSPAFAEGLPEKAAPPVLPKYSIPARRGHAGAAAEFARCSRALREFRRLAAVGGLGHVERDPRRPSAILLRATLRSPAASVLAHRQGSTVLLDAAAGLRLPELAPLFAVPPPLITVAAADGAPVARTLIRTLATGRKAREGEGGRFSLSTAAAHAVRVAVAWALEAAPIDELLVIAPRLVRIALEQAHPATGPARRQELQADWKRLEQPADALAQAAALLAPELAPLAHARLLWGHYGAVRGLDAAKACKAMITLGDPWPNLGSVRQEVRHFLGAEAPLEQLARATDARMVALAAAELEQAHGRLRAPRRSSPARALHVGTVVPRGWAQVDVRQIPAGRPEAVARPEAVTELRELVARLGGQRAAARASGVAQQVIGRQVSGERAPTDEVLRQLRRVAKRLG